jgi:hypothetical protein
MSSIVVLFDDVGKIVIELASQLETQNEVIKELRKNSAFSLA